MIAPAHPLLIETVPTEAEIPPEAITAVAAFLLSVVDGEGETEEAAA